MTDRKSVWVGFVETNNDISLFAGNTQADVKAEIAGWCKENWGDLNDGIIPATDDEILEGYFSYWGDENERCHFEEVKVR